LGKLEIKTGVWFEILYKATNWKTDCEIILKITLSKKSSSEGVNVCELYQCKVQQQIFKLTGSISKETASQLGQLNDSSREAALWNFFCELDMIKNNYFLQ
jgi:hypothetical protein